MKLIEALIRNHPLANITFAVVLLLGLMAYLAMPREQDPEINFNWVMINAALPGAAAADVEKRITTPLEDAIKSVSDIRFVISSSRESMASILVRFREIDERTFDKRINDLRREIQNKAKAELPPEAREPRVLEITTSNGFPTANVLLVGQANDEVLRRSAKEVRDDLERMSGVDVVYANGLNDPELRVEFSPHAAALRGLSGGDIADAVAAWFRDTFAGKVDVGEGEAARSWLVRVLGQQADADYLARLNVTPRANPRAAPVPLADIARVERQRARAERLVSHEGQPAVMMAITKKSQVNTLQLIERIEQYLHERNAVLAGQGLRLVLLDDQTVPTRQAIDVMQTNALLGLGLVLAISWLFLGTRIALLIAIGIPFSLAGTFAILHALGYTLNVSVLLGIVIVLGMLVDDAVVVVEAIYYRLQRGSEALAASLDALREVAAPVTASVVTTMAAFLPLMLLPGIVGKFMFVIPFVVTLGLAISLIEAYWMLPAHVTALNIGFQRPSRVQRWRNAFTHRLRLAYGRLLARSFRHPVRTLTLALAALLLAVAAMAGGLIKIQFFAFDPLRLFYINIDMPADVPLERTLREAERLEAIARKHLLPGEARGIASVAGLKFTDTEPLYGDPYGQVTVSLNPRGEGGREVQEVVEAMRAEAEALPGPGKVSFTLISGGPPAEKPVRVRVRGDDPQELRRAADDLLAIVRAIPGTRDVHDDDVPGRPQLVLRLDGEAVRAAGLDPAQVARALRLLADGEVVASMRDRGDKLDVRVRARHEAGEDVAQLLDAPLPLAGGGLVRLRDLVTVTAEEGRGVIRHYNLRRAITIEADLDKDVIDTLEANRRIEQAWAEIALRHPAVSLDFSGELDDINESLAAMARLFLLGVGLIYLILAAQFRSYFLPLLILLTVPLAFTGVTYGLTIARVPLSLYTLYGVIALTGIAVNSAIVLIDAANDRYRRGMGALHAAIWAGRRRVVPVIITSVTTIGGLFSLAVGLGGKSLLWGPVASAIVWGLGFSTVLTLFVVPVCWYLAMRRLRRAGP